MKDRSYNSWMVRLTAHFKCMLQKFPILNQTKNLEMPPASWMRWLPLNQGIFLLWWVDIWQSLIVPLIAITKIVQMSCKSWQRKTFRDIWKLSATSLFVFSIVGPKQNARSLLTPVSNTVFHALSHGSFGFALLGSFFNHVLIGGNSSTANQILWNKWLLEVPWRAKPRVPCQKA